MIMELLSIHSLAGARARSLCSLRLVGDIRFRTREYSELLLEKIHSYNQKIILTCKRKKKYNTKQYKIQLKMNILKALVSA